MLRISMMNSILISVLFVLIVINECAVPFVKGIELENSLYNQDLYRDIDDTIILHNSNISDNIYGSNESWVVAFYGVHCSQCTEFKHIWVNFSNEILMLRDLRVATFNCSIPDNGAVCVKKNITDFPTVKFYPPYSRIDSFGITVELSDSVKHLGRSIIDLMRKRQEALNTYWRNVTIYTACVFSGFLALIGLISAVHIFHKWKLQSKIDAYAVLHKSNGDDEDGVELNIKY